MSEIETVSAESRLRICVVGDVDGIHTQSWLSYFVARGHDVHAIAYHVPARPPEGVTVHTLRPAAGGGERPVSGSRPGLASRLPPAMQRLANLVRYRHTGLAAAVDEIAPDVLHAHYLVEHGLYATAANFRPYVVSAWGSDVLVDAATSTFYRAIARFVLRRATLATANNRHMLREMVQNLGAAPSDVQHIVLGVSREYVESSQRLVGEATSQNEQAPTIISSRSLESSLYNVDTIIRSMVRVRERLPGARLVIAGGGRLRPELEALAESRGLGAAVHFAGQLSQEELQRAFVDAGVFVSVPSSDGTSVALLQAMACGAFPVVSDLPSQRELVDDGVSGLRVPVRDARVLADAIVRALEDGQLRSDAAERNLAFVNEYGVLETNMARMEAWYYRLASRATEADPAAFS